VVIVVTVESEPASNLSAPRPGFVGRGEELGRLASLCEGTDRVVLVTGPPGVGKSRLAIEAMRVWLEQSGERRALVVDLAAAATREDALRRIGAVLGLSFGPTEDAEARIGDALCAHDDVALLLDDCDGVAAVLADVLSHFVASAADARMLVTSRRDLAPSLRHARLTLSPLREEDALSMLTARARSVRPDFSLPVVHAQPARALLRHLDRLPLAIELISPRLRLLSVPQLLSRFERGEQGDALQAALSRSWELLTEVERAALCQSAVFRDGFDLEAAEAVIDLSAHQGAPDLLTVLEGLVAQSLLRTTTLPELPDDVRMQHFESVRQLALSHLHAAADVRGRHVRYYVERAHSWDAGIESEDELACTRRLMVELPNLEAAFEHSAGDAATRARLGLLLHLVYQRRGPFSGQETLCDRVIEDAAVVGDDVLRAEALLARARTMRWAGDVAPAVEQLREARTLAKTDPVVEAACLRNEAACHFRAGDTDTAGQCIEDALSTAQRSGRASDHINALNGVGYLWTVRGDHDRAERALEDALQRARRSRIPGLIALVTSSLAELTLQRGRLEDAQRYSDEAIAHYEALSYLRQLALEWLQRGTIRMLGDLPGAQEDAERALEMTIRLGLGAAHQRATSLLGRIAFFERDFHRAHGLLARALDDAPPVQRPRLCLYDGAACAALGQAVQARQRFAEFDALDDAMDDAKPPACADLLRGFQSVEGDEAPLARELAQGALSDADPERRRCAAALLDRVFADVSPRRAASRVTLELSADARRFRVVPGAPVDLTRRRALRAILQRLAQQHVARPGEPLGLAQVLEAGWPGERMGADSGARRVYVTINRLRKLGLGALVLTMGDGYMLSPNLDIARPSVAPDP